MLRYVFRRCLYAVPTLFGVMLLTFVLFFASASPETMARRNLSAKNPTHAQIVEWEHQHGYDRSLKDQFLTSTRGLFLLDFGKSDTTGELIWVRIKQGAGPSLTIASIEFVAILLTSICFALVLAYFRGTYVDYWGTFFCVLMMSVVYIVYIIAGQYLLGKVLKFYPIQGFHGGADSLRFVLLPTIIGTLSSLGSSARLYRTFLLDQVNQDFVRTARAKGVSERVVLFKHVLKNASLPILTSTVATIPLLFLGSLLLESFFSIPGLGNYLVDAINNQDFSVVRAMVFLGALLTILGYILTDVMYAVFDPRVRLE